jgi:hypothetical protein
LPLAAAEALGRTIERSLIPPAEALPHLPAVLVTEAGRRRVAHGNPVGPEHLARPWVAEAALGATVRVLDGGGGLVALARPRNGVLHPVVVLG